MHKANLLAKTIYDSKKLMREGNFLRPKLLSHEKHVPLKFAELDEHSRIREGIEERAGASLRENFNMELYLNPVWKSVDKKMWRSKRGMSYEGQPASHVATQRQTLFGGTGLQNTALLEASNR